MAYRTVSLNQLTETAQINHFVFLQKMSINIDRFDAETREQIAGMGNIIFTAPTEDYQRIFCHNQSLEVILGVGEKPLYKADSRYLCDPEYASVSYLQPKFVRELELT